MQRSEVREQRSESRQVGIADGHDLETQNSKPETAAAGERSEESYVIDAGLKLLRLLECVEGKNFEPVTINRLMQRTGFNRDLTRRLIITAKRGRWLKEILAGRERQFIPGPKLENLARSYADALVRSARADRNELFS